MNKTIDKYFDKFGKFPPQITTIPFDDENYIKLMKAAISFDKEITPEILENYFDPDDMDLII